MSGNGKMPSGVVWLRRLVLAGFGLAVMVLIFERGPGAGWKGWGRAEAQGGSNVRLSGEDCSYLRDPDEFRGVEERHRIDRSRESEALAGMMHQAATRLIPAQELPRRNYIDQHIFDRMGRAGIESAPICTDEEFIRRVTLDLTGRIPKPEAVTAFLSDTAANKRDRLIDSLIGSPEFVDKWALFFGDLFKNNSNATNITRYIAGREAFARFIRDSIDYNRPYNQIATEMITATGGSATNGAVNFIVGGNVPMGPAQDTMDGLAVQTSTVFLGISSMDCLLCHDGAGHLDAVNIWGSGVTRAQAYGMSAFFARTQRAFVRASATANYGTYTIQEGATGEYALNTNSGNRQTRSAINGKATSDPKYLFSGAGVNTGENRRQALARHITGDPQFARAAVNYIWEELMVEALVSPSNTFDLARLDPAAKLPPGWTLQPNNPELLAALAQDFRQNGFNLRQLIGTIAKSTAYQLSSQYPGTWKLEYVPFYARKFARRLDAEEVHDAVVQATGIPPLTSYREPGATVNTTIFGYPILNDEGIKLREVLWANQLPEPLEPRQRADVRAFLDSFLRGNRDSNDRVRDASILQALNLMNNTFVTTRIRMADRVTIGSESYTSTVGRLLGNTALSNEQIITQLYLATLSRNPTEVERSKLLRYFTGMTKQAAVEAIQWVLLNKVDFIYNY